ncbi:hypothetical protein FH972_007599 [Carpinus fangiana]|uniref:Uncharacterized protein n=1 Tax=Carpinus fangiana TaxID=176857 RepID=A0A5N6QW03_9ROSI|nr:hypothetical protein FH972_007599 [Carpinus fangiana]
MEEWVFSDPYAGVAMVNQMGGGLGVGIESGWWEQRVLGEARWAAWECWSRLGGAASLPGRWEILGGWVERCLVWKILLAPPPTPPHTWPFPASSSFHYPSHSSGEAHTPYLDAQSGFLKLKSTTHPSAHISNALPSPL